MISKYSFSNINIKHKPNTVYKILLFLIIAFLITFNLFYYLKNKTTKVLGVSDETSKEIIYWNDFLSQNPEYKNGWLKLAILQYRKGDINEVYHSLKKVENLDPNSEELKNIKKKMGL